VFAIVPVKYVNVKNQEFNRSESYFVNVSEQSSALNFLVLATELKLLIFKISAPSADGLKISVSERS
jgi:hypothetical protein